MGPACGSRHLLAEFAWLGPEQGAASDVLMTISGDRFTAVEPNAAAVPPGTTRLPGLTMPGAVNAHSHAFHRALRGAGEAGTGDFWTWRNLMYSLAGGLDPDTYRELATATYAEMVLAGITSVGEFHYLHHPPGGGRYSDPNEMGLALVEAAAAAGVRITLFDTCYLQGGVDGRALEGAQVRFGDGDAQAWALRVDALMAAVATPGAAARVGVAAHSVRAVPPAALRSVGAFAATRDVPVHVHLSEQRRENEECLAAHGCSPAALLESTGLASRRTTAVHATHLAAHDITILGLAGTSVCACPTTERDLADGVGPFADLADAGSPLCIGTDSHAVIDPFEEMRGIETNERLMTNRRGSHSAVSLLAAGTGGGAAAIGWPECGRIATGAAADLVTVSLDSPQLAGARSGGTASLAAHVVFAAGARDVVNVIVGGVEVVQGGEHLLLGDVAGRLERSVAAARRGGAAR